MPNSYRDKTNTHVIVTEKTSSYLLVLVWSRQMKAIVLSSLKAFDANIAGEAALTTVSLHCPRPDTISFGQLMLLSDIENHSLPNISIFF